MGTGLKAATPQGGQEQGKDAKADRLLSAVSIRDAILAGLDAGRRARARVLQVSAGGSHSVVLVEYTSDIGSGSKDADT